MSDSPVIHVLQPMLPGNPPTPCPELLTPDEAIRYLRLDTLDVKPLETLRYYRKNGLRATQISKGTFYLRSELDRFLKMHTKLNPR